MKTIEDIRIKPISWLKGGIFCGILLLVYYSTFKRLIGFDWQFEDYSHCMLVPLVVLYLLWERRREIAGAPAETSWAGFVPLGIGICFFWLGELAGEYFTLYMSFWLVVVGLLWLHLGWRKIKAMWFALVMMLAMFPFPNFITTRITFQLRLISSKLGVMMLHIYGMSAYREGNVIDLGFTQLQVVDACSGLRYVMPLMILSLLLAYWFKAHWWKRIVLFLSAIPVAILVNSFRIAATGVLYSMFGARVAEGFFHGFSGWLIFMFAIPFLLFEMWVLRYLPPKAKRFNMQNSTLEAEGSNDEAGNCQSAISDNVIKSDGKGVSVSDLKSSTSDNALKSILRPTFIVSALILLLTFILSQGVDFRQKVPVLKSFSQFPVRIGEWRGEREEIAQQLLNVLKFSDYTMVNYKNPQGKIINFYVAYYQDQQKGESIHSPETCLPASGWGFNEAGITVIRLAGGKTLSIARAFIEKGGEKQLIYYWFPVHGRVLTRLYQLKIYAFWDSLTKRRTDGALVRIITPVSNGERLNDAEDRLQDFTRQTLPILDEYIPK